jgi:fumarate hydratase subunit beta
MINIQMPLSEDKARELVYGDVITLSGIIYTARDAAHKRLIECINNNEELPFDLDNQAIYYVGPTPTKPGEIIGSAGPTTSYRMDDLTIPLLERGLRIMIGKGKRDKKVIQAMQKYGVVYLAAIGGAGAYISNSIKSCEIIAYEDLGAEAIRKLEVNDLQLIVAIDSYGNNIYEKGREAYAK